MPSNIPANGPVQAPSKAFQLVGRPTHRQRRHCSSSLRLGLALLLVLADNDRVLGLVVLQQRRQLLYKRLLRPLSQGHALTVGGGLGSWDDQVQAGRAGQVPLERLWE